jgi:hypothetical protein
MYQSYSKPLQKICKDLPVYPQKFVEILTTPSPPFSVLAGIVSLTRKKAAKRGFPASLYVFSHFSSRCLGSVVLLFSCSALCQPV